jgi:hypothetical protein
MRVAYFNDEKHPILVQVQDANGEQVFTVQPVSMCTFDFVLPSSDSGDPMMFIKKWKGKTLISYSYTELHDTTT